MVTHGQGFLTKHMIFKFIRNLTEVRPQFTQSHRGSEKLPITDRV